MGVSSCIEVLYDCSDTCSGDADQQSDMEDVKLLRVRKAGLKHIRRTSGHGLALVSCNAQHALQPYERGRAVLRAAIDCVLHTHLSHREACGE